VYREGRDLTPRALKQLDFKTHDLNEYGDSTSCSGYGFGSCIFDDIGRSHGEGLPRFICNRESIWNRHVPNPA